MPDEIAENIEEQTTEEAVLNMPLEEDEVQSEVEEAEAEEEVQEEVSEENQVEQKPKKKVSGFKRRLNRERERAEEAEQRARQLEQQLSQYQQPKQEAPEQGSDAPSPNDYEHGINDINYINDSAAYRGKVAAREEFMQLEQTRQQKQQYAKVQSAFQAVEEKYMQTLDDVANEVDDFEEVFSNAVDPKLNENLAYAIKDSDLGGKIMYHLFKNPDELAKIKKMPPVRAVREIGRLETKLQTPAQPKKPVSKMNKPIRPIGSGKSTNKLSYDDGMAQDEFNRNFPIEDLM